jgi:hypothetical protein
MSEFMDDDRIDERGIQILRQSITEAKSIFGTTGSPSSLRLGDLDTRYPWETRATPELMNSWDDISSEFLFGIMDI